MTQTADFFDMKDNELERSKRREKELRRLAREFETPISKKKIEELERNVPPERIAPVRKELGLKKPYKKKNIRPKKITVKEYLQHKIPFDLPAYRRPRKKLLFQYVEGTKIKKGREVKDIKKVPSGLSIFYQTSVGGNRSPIKDSKRKAMLPGWRISKNGKPYFENRVNRSDVLPKKKM